MLTSFLKNKNQSNCTQHIVKAHNLIFFLFLVIFLQIKSNKTVADKRAPMLFSQAHFYTIKHISYNTILKHRKYNQFLIFLKKKIRNYSNVLTIIIKKSLKSKSVKYTRKIKVLHPQWKTIKKNLIRQRKRHLNVKKLTTVNLSKKLTVVSANRINYRRFKKYVLSRYKTYRRLNIDLFKKRYLKWSKKYKTSFKYSRFVASNLNEAKTAKFLKVLTYITKLNTKKQSSSLLKKKNPNIRRRRVRILNYRANTPPFKANYKTVETGKTFNTIKSFAIYKSPSTPLIQLSITHNNITCNETQYLNASNNFTFRKSINSTYSKIVATKKKLSENIYNMLFNQSLEWFSNYNKLPNRYLSSTPQLFLKSLSSTKKNLNEHISANLFFDFNDSIHENNNKNARMLNNKLSKNFTANYTNNYSPIYFFNSGANNTHTQILTYAKTQNYYYTVNVLTTTKYKTFFIFFVLNFLESYLHKKIWVRVSTKDPIDIFWKNYITFFLKKNSYLYKKFNKLIAVRELLEIVWITFKTHDLQILLNFLKKKFENAHFKKHKKILSIFFDVIRKNEYLLRMLNIKGFFFDIRGKVGVSGNAKKRHHSFSLGKITTTSQNVGSYFQQISVWTPTGQMGITCILQY